MNHLLKKFWKDIAGLLWFALAVFLGFALFSYHPTDPSFNSVGNSTVAQNFCGYFGSFLADIVYQLFGIASWVFVLGAARMSYLCFNNKNTRIQPWRLGVGVLLIFTASSLIALYFPQQKIFAGQIQLGGILGLIGRAHV